MLIFFETRGRVESRTRTRNVKSAAMGIRTPVAGVRGPHDWPDYTIAATALFYEAYSYLNLLIIAFRGSNTGLGWVFEKEIPVAAMVVHLSDGWGWNC